MTLTPEEIKQIEDEAQKESLPFEKYGMINSEFHITGYIEAATKYLLQLKSERERAGKLINGLRIIAEESKDMTIVSYAKMLINQYKNNQ